MNNKQDITIGGQMLFSYRIVESLIEKKVLTQEEGADIMTKTANDVRSGSEDGDLADVGENLARVYEKYASWCLGYPS